MDDYHFRPVDSERGLRHDLLPFIHGKELSYPRYDQWIEERCIPDLRSGYKKAMVVASNGVVVGDAIWQLDKRFPRTVEFKQCRIDPRAWGHYIGHFFVRQIEMESRDIADAIIADTRDPAVRDFLLSTGFRVAYAAPVYGDGILDYVMLKDIRKKHSPVHT